MNREVKYGRVVDTPPTQTAFSDFMLVHIPASASPPASINPLVSLTVQPPLTFQTTTLPDSARGLNYGAGLSIIGGRVPYKVNITSGALTNGPAWSAKPYASTFNATGRPTAAGR